jgi:hypothetical protein
MEAILLKYKYVLKTIWNRQITEFVLINSDPNNVLQTGAPTPIRKAAILTMPAGSIRKMRDCPPALQHVGELVDDLQQHSASHDRDQWMCSGFAKQSKFLNSLNLGICIQGKPQDDTQGDLQEPKNEQEAHEHRKEVQLQKSHLGATSFHDEGHTQSSSIIEFPDEFCSKSTRQDTFPRTASYIREPRTHTTEFEDIQKVIAYASCQVDFPSNVYPIKPTNRAETPMRIRSFIQVA